MFFVLQQDKENPMDEELFALKKILTSGFMPNEFIEASITYFDNNENIKFLKSKNATPVGSILFVQKYLEKAFGIKNMNPIEIPKSLRMRKFLKRNYSIVEGKYVPHKGYTFIKNASRLKDFSFMGDLEDIEREDHHDFSIFINPDELYVLSEPKQILAEYRIHVYFDEIKACQYYDGDPLVFPSKDDVKMLKEMVLRWMADPTRPQAYAMDIAIINNNGKEEAMLLEVCPFTSLGTYGFISNELPGMYREGFEWYVKHNTIPEVYTIR